MCGHCGVVYYVLYQFSLWLPDFSKLLVLLSCLVYIDIDDIEHVDSMFANNVMVNDDV